jgi:hypothetical protein
VSKGIVSKDSLKIKIDNILKEVYRYVYPSGEAAVRADHGRIDVVCGLDTGLVRKPCTGTFDLVRAIRQEQMNLYFSSDGVVAVSHMFMSMYVGDAAGRRQGPARSKDFGDSDLKFALNVGCDVSTLSYCCHCFY